MPDRAAVDVLRAVVRGPVLTADDERYERARRVFNAAIDRRPALIARCADANDVIASVTVAREHDLALSVRGGGHSVSGKAVCDGGLMIDLSAMKGIRVDPSARSARAETGLTLGEFDRETQRFDLATTLGVVSGTGIAGLTLGGGIGWLNGACGLACDNVRGFDVVLADGTLVRADAVEHEDLYWALRGGSGNFGVVTAIDYHLHRVASVLVGALFYPLECAKDVLHRYVEFASAAPDAVTTMAELVTLPGGVPAVGISVCCCGALSEGQRAIAPLRSFAPLLAEEIAPMPYVAAQAMLDGFFPDDRHHYWKSNLTSGVSDEAIDTMIEFARSKPSPWTMVGLQQMHGVAGRVPAEATAFAHRGDRFDCLILSQWADGDDAARNVAWTRELHARLQPLVDAAVYVNNLGEEPDAVVRAAFGGNYDRLLAVKRRFDPDNVFRSTHNILPDLQSPAVVV
jgi:FAD/FMN-containing dehydrogenase